MLRNFLVIEEGRHKNMGRFLNELDYVLIVKVDTFRVLKDKAGLTAGDELPLKRLDTLGEGARKNRSPVDRQDLTLSIFVLIMYSSLVSTE